MSLRPIPGLDLVQNQKIAAVFNGAPGLARVVLYGSRAMGRHRPNSDIDLAIWGDLDWHQTAALADALDELPLPYVFDLQHYETITLPSLRDHIARVGIEIYAA